MIISFLFSQYDWPPLLGVRGEMARVMHAPHALASGDASRANNYMTETGLDTSDGCRASLPEDTEVLFCRRVEVLIQNKMAKRRLGAALAPALLLLCAVIGELEVFQQREYHASSRTHARRTHTRMRLGNIFPTF